MSIDFIPLSLLLWKSLCGCYALLYHCGGAVLGYSRQFDLLSTL